MRLSVFSNYALRTLMYAAMRDEQLCRSRDIATAFGISKPHMTKCVHQLGQWGYLENVRGRSGGFRLAKPASTITVGEIIRRTEDTMDLVECFAPATNTCPLIQICRLSQTFKRALSVFMNELDSVTIADIVANKSSLMPLLFETEIDA